jgi:hypothetical protein
MENDIFAAHRIGTDWALTLPDGKLPAELQAALEVFDAADAARPPAVADTITTKNAQEVIAAAVDAEIRNEKWATVQSRIVGGLARTVLSAAVNATPELIPRLEPQFRADVNAFVAAVAELPDDITPDGLVRAGSDALRAYEDTLAAQGAVKRYDNWLASVPWSQTVRNDLSVLRVIRPKTRADYIALCNAGANRDKSKISSVYLYAARNGLDWAMTPPWEAKILAEELNTPTVTARAL